VEKIKKRYGCQSPFNIRKETGSNDAPKRAQDVHAAMRNMIDNHATLRIVFSGAQSFAEVLRKPGRMIGPDTDIGP
jgi:hypothetical protein